MLKLRNNHKLNPKELKELLEELHDRYNRREFIEDDPICIPHRFTKKEDIEVAGFITALLAWGQRSQIIKNAQWLMDLMDNSPFNFIINASSSDLNRLDKFYYRTFNSIDAKFIVSGLRQIYENGGLHKLMVDAYDSTSSIKVGLEKLHHYFESLPSNSRSMKHIANVNKGSSAKRLNMYLRWMIRQDDRRVDFGLWKEIPSSSLFIPLDVHSGRIARELKLLNRNQNDWKAVEELTINLRKIDSTDPVKYDFALFGLGVNNKL